MLRRTFLLAGTAVTAGIARRAGAAGPQIVVGGKNFTEQLVIAAITNEYLTAKGFSVDLRTGLGTAALRAAQEAGQVDLYWEYTGTSLITFNKVTEKLSPEDTFARVKTLDAAKGLAWLNPTRVNNTYALAMRKADAAAKGVATISELAGKVKGGPVKFGCNAEFYARPDGLKPLEEAYGFQFGRENVVRMDTGLVYQALRDSQVEVGLVFATDGRIPAFDFQVLRDDKGFFPSYALTPVIRSKVLEANPKLAELLNALSAKLDDQTMATMNAAVDVQKKSVEQVAGEFLKSQGSL